MSFIAAHSRDPVLHAKIHSSVTAPKIIHSDDEVQPLLGPIARNDLDSHSPRRNHVWELRSLDKNSAMQTVNPKLNARLAKPRLGSVIFRCLTYLWWLLSDKAIPSP